MKEKIFEMSEHGPFRAKVDERFHKLRQDCPDDGWVTGYLYRDLHNGEVLPHIFNCPCRWIVQEETIEPVGFHIAQWIKVEDRLPEMGKWVMVYYKAGVFGIGYFGVYGWISDNDEGIAIPDYWQEIVTPKED